MEKITLVFDISNDFDPVAEKYGTQGSKEGLIKNARWFIDNALASIESCYNEGAPRRVEMTKLHNNLMKQLEDQLDSEGKEMLNT
jgi:hypothetical protein